MSHSSDHKTPLGALVIGAIGVVYGDIGTSPLYAVKESFHHTHGIHATEANLLGLISLLFWELLIVVTFKYVFFIMRADNNGEGGMMSLMALVQKGLAKDRKDTQSGRFQWVLMLMGIFGAALFYGDSVITPAISVLSAVEGLNVATTTFQPFIIPICLIVLIALFAIQRRGTEKVGKLFGPITLVWFLTLALLGIYHISQDWSIFSALNPMYAVNFFFNNGWNAFVVLGSAVLAITGGEALYADMGHFGKKPIRVAWLYIIFPCLLLNYMGQAALLRQNPEYVSNPLFYMLPPSFPDWTLYILVILAMLATIIASQAVITGAYSLTQQAIQLGYIPRMDVLYTSEKEAGQIYVPTINWLLLIAVVASVVGFQTSSNLAAAYGIAVTGTMAITTTLALVVARKLWHWPIAACVVVGAFFLIIDLAFFSANLLKVTHGGWFPLLLGFIIFLLLATWKRGRDILYKKLQGESIGLEVFLDSLSLEPPHHVKGTAIFLTTDKKGVPHALLHNLNHNKVLHERNVLLTITNHNVPYIPESNRIEIEHFDQNFHRAIIHYGFQDKIDIPKALQLCAKQGLAFNLMQTTFFLNRQTLLVKHNKGMYFLRKKIFERMMRNTVSPTTFFRIPANRVVELGRQIEF